jgi:hypothetical protein
VAERQSCKLKVLGSIPSGGFHCRSWHCFRAKCWADASVGQRITEEQGSTRGTNSIWKVTRSSPNWLEPAMHEGTSSSWELWDFLLRVGLAEPRLATPQEQAGGLQENSPLCSLPSPCAL